MTFFTSRIFRYRQNTQIEFVKTVYHLILISDSYVKRVDQK